MPNRNGPVGEIILGCDIARGRFWDLAEPAWTWKPDRATATTDRPITAESAFEQPQPPDKSDPGF